MLHHIGFIMDGNGRWAKQRNLPRTSGHLEGAKRISEIILGCKKHDVKEVSFFAFSTENWNRPKTEVTYLINLLKKYLFSKKSLKWFNDNNVCCRFIGFEKTEYKKLFKDINDFCKQTEKNDSIIVNICFNYGSQSEIVDACNKAIKLGKKVTINSLNKLMQITTPLDLLIRTSGEERISNFLLWQLAYAEIIFEETLWPDYKVEILDKNIITFNQRNRRFGGLSE